MTETYPDRTGYPIRVTCFVAVDAQTKVGRTTFRGQVYDLGQDAVGPLLRIREWRDGKFTGKERVARPGDSEVRRKPAGLRELEAEAERREVRASTLAQEQAKERARRARLRKKKASSRRRRGR